MSIGELFLKLQRLLKAFGFGWSKLTVPVFAVLTLALLELISIASLGPVFLIFLGGSDTTQNTDRPAIMDLVSPEAMLVGIAILFVVIAVLKSLAQYLLTRFVYVLERECAEKSFFFMSDASYSWFTKSEKADLQATVLNEVSMVVKNAILPIAQGAVSLAMTLTLVAYLAYQSFAATLGIIVLLLGFYGITYLVFKQRLERQGKLRAEANKQRFSSFASYLGNIKEIKISKHSMGIDVTFVSALKNFAQASVFSTLLQLIPRYLLEALAIAGILVLFLFQRANGVNDIQAALPFLGSVAYAGFKILPALQNTYASWIKLQYSVAAIERVQGFLDSISVEIEESRGQLDEIDCSTRDTLRQTISERGGTLCVRDVNFSYSTSQSSDRQLGLHNVSFDLKIGSKGKASLVGIYGKSGSGKSTLCDVLTGIRPSQDGSMTLSVTNSDGNEITVTSMNAAFRIGYVSETSQLMAESVRSNLGAATENESVKDSDLIRVLETAGAMEFISASEGGLDQLAGDDGRNFSFGQRLRLLISRALIRKPDILILDEATAGLDIDKEREVLSNVRTSGVLCVIVVSHRTGIFESFDQSIELSSGKVVSVL